MSAKLIVTGDLEERVLLRRSDEAGSSVLVAPYGGGVAGLRELRIDAFPSGGFYFIDEHYEQLNAVNGEVRNGQGRHVSRV